VRFFVPGGSEFDDPNVVSSDPRELAITCELRRWASSSNDERLRITAGGSELSVALEYYLCAALEYRSSQNTSGWWCDGVVELSISQPSARSFVLAGAGYWADASGGFYLAPFEIEFHFSKENTQVPVRVVVRFGVADRLGKIVRTECDRRTSYHVAQNRPTHDSDWAFAIELT
jgi:hypothetical protein